MTDVASDFACSDRFGFGSVCLTPGREYTVVTRALFHVTPIMHRLVPQASWLDGKQVYMSVVFDEDLTTFGVAIAGHVRPVRFGRKSFANWLKIDIVFDCLQYPRLTQDQIDTDVLHSICTTLADYAEAHGHSPSPFRDHAGTLSPPAVSAIAAISHVTRPKRPKQR